MRLLKRVLSKLLERGVSFLEGIKKNERIVLVYDTDVDGVASAALFLIAMKKMGKEIKTTVPSTFKRMGMGGTDASDLKTLIKNFDRVITVDVPVDLIERYLVGMKKEMLVIDHHPGNDLNSRRVVLINPRLERPEVYQPVSYVVYKMFLRFLKRERWLAALGTVGDYGIDDCRDLVKIKSKKNIWRTKYGKAAMLVTSYIAVYGPEKTLRMFLASKNLDDVVHHREIKLASERFKKELKRCREEFWKNAEVHGRLVISEIKARQNRVGSTLITRLATENQEKIVILFERDDNLYRVHGRNESGDVDMGELFKKFCNGGGHKEASSGIIRKNEISDCKGGIIRELAKFTGKRV